MMPLDRNADDMEKDHPWPVGLDRARKALDILRSARPTTPTVESLESDTLTELIALELQLRGENGIAGNVDELLACAPSLCHSLISRLVERGRAAAPALPQLPHLPGYELLDRIGEGGMAVVYRAKQLGLSRIVAVKFLRGVVGESNVARFKIEATAAARLSHPNVVAVYDVGEIDGQSYLTMEFVANGTMADRLSGTPLPAFDAARLIVPLAEAIDLAHRAGIVHRDLKPANILLHSPTPADFRLCDCVPKVADFGLAKLVAEQGQTQTGEVVGTPSYMAPEQAQPRLGPLGPAVDIHALGAILYELLTGRPPFRAESAVETLVEVAVREPLAPRKLNPKIPRDLETICLKCLSKDPRRRYASGRDLAADLQRFIAGSPILARRTPIWEIGAKWVKRQPLAAGALAACLAVATVLLGQWIAFTEQLKNQRDLADERLVEAQRNLVHAHSAVKSMLTQVAEDHELRKHFPDALRRKLLVTARDFMEKIRSENAIDAETRHAAAVSYLQLAWYTNDMGLDIDVTADVKRGLDLLTALAAEFPDHRAYAGDLAVATTSYAGRLLTKFDFEAALLYYRRAFDAWKHLAEHHGDVVRHRWQFGVVHARLAALERRLGRIEEAERLLRAAADIHAGLIREHPNVVAHWQERAEVLRELGKICHRTGRLDEAAKLFAEGQSHSERLMSLKFLAEEHFLARAKTLRERGRLALDQGDLDAASQFLNLAANDIDPLTIKQPHNRHYKRSQANVLHSKGILAWRQRRIADAMSHLQSAAQLQSEISQGAIAQHDATLEFAETGIELVRLCLESKKPEAAAHWRTASLEAMQRLPAQASHCPDAVRIASTLAEQALAANSN